MKIATDAEYPKSNLPKHKRVKSGGFPNPRKDQIRREMADNAFALIKINENEIMLTVSCPGMRTNEHEVVGHNKREDSVILAEHSPDICALNPKAIPGDILDVLTATGEAGFPKIAALDMDIFRGAIKKDYADKVIKVLKSGRMRRKFAIRATCPLGRMVGNTPAKELDNKINKEFRVISYSEVPYRGGADGRGMAMKVFQWVCAEK